MSVPRFEPPRNGFMQAHRGKLAVAAVVAALVGVGHAMKGLNLTRELYGRGYVPWVQPAWKAKQAAARLRKPLVVVSGAACARLEALTPHEAVEPLVDRLVWLREAPDGGGPATVEVVTADMETTLAGPWTLEATTSPLTLRAWLLEGLERAPP